MKRDGQTVRLLYASQSSFGGLKNNIYLKKLSVAISIFAVCMAQVCSFSRDCGLHGRPSVLEIELKLMVREP